MKKNIVILGSLFFITLLLFICSCNKTKCYECEYYYYPGTYVNSITNDTINLYLTSKSYGIDTLIKYYKLGYERSGNGSTDFVLDNLCDEELDSLYVDGINYNCKF